MLLEPTAVRILSRGAAMCVALAVVAPAQTGPRDRGKARKIDPISAEAQNEQTIETYVLGCQHGRVESCLEAIKKIEQSGHKRKERERILDLRHRACEAGHGASCIQWADRGLQRVLKSKPGAPDPVQLFQAYARACASKTPGGCLRTGWMHHAGVGTAVDIRKARDVYLEGCALRDRESCMEAGKLTWQNRDLVFTTPADRQRGVEAYLTACDLKEARGCARAARLLHRTSCDADNGGGGGGEPVYNAYARGCELNDGPGCTGVGWCFEHGVGVRKDRDQAAAAYQRGCELGDSEGCKGAAAFR